MGSPQSDWLLVRCHHLFCLSGFIQRRGVEGAFSLLRLLWLEVSRLESLLNALLNLPSIASTTYPNHDDHSPCLWYFRSPWKTRVQCGNKAHPPHILLTPTFFLLQYPSFFMCVLLCFPIFFAYLGIWLCELECDWYRGFEGAGVLYLFRWWVQVSISMGKPLWDLNSKQLWLLRELSFKWGC